MNQFYVPRLSREKKWYHCPNCGKNLLIYDDGAKSAGVFIRCKGCRKTIEIRI